MATLTEHLTDELMKKIFDFDKMPEDAKICAVGYQYTPPVTVPVTTPAPVKKGLPGSPTNPTKHLNPVCKVPWLVDKPAKPFVVRKKDPCECNQGAELKQTGYGPLQGPTHYCPCCRVGFWTVEVKPTYAQIKLENLTDPKATETSMKYEALKNEPASSWGTTARSIMINQLGGKTQTWLSNEKREYWVRLYCGKFPNSIIALNRKKRLEADD